jgi:DNA polymerase III delta subunit
MAEVYIICGDDYFRKIEIDKVKSQYDFSIKSDYPDKEGLFRDLFFESVFDSGRKAVVVRGLDMKKWASDLILRFSKSSSNDCLIVSEGDPKKAKAFAKKIDGVQLVELSKANKPNDGVKFSIDRAKDFGFTLNRDGAKLLVDLCGLDYAMLSTEIDKLSDIFPGEDIGEREVYFCINRLSGNSDFLSLYVSIMTGDTSESIRHAHNMKDEMTLDAVLGSIIKILHATIIISLFDGDKDRAFDFSTAKREEAKTSFSSIGGVKKSKDPAPTKFLYNVSDKVQKRILCKRKVLALYENAYNSLVNSRVKQNENLALAQLDKIICLMCRR